MKVIRQYETNFGQCKHWRQIQRWQADRFPPAKNLLTEAHAGRPTAESWADANNAGKPSTDEGSN